jgi:SAM-dependent methyltransferase
MDAIEVSGDKWRSFGWRSYRQTEYPEYDVCAGPLDCGIADMVIAEQVLEHVERPDRAVCSMYDMLRPGGHLLVGTPFLLKVHGAPDDYYRWTERGIRVLLESAGFIAVQTASWGNRRCLVADMNDGLTWTNYRPWHSLRNEPQFPIVVWAFASRARATA